MSSTSENAIDLLPGAAGEDTALVAELCDLVNRAYAFGEQGLWLDDSRRIGPAELTASIRDGQIAVARRRGRVVGCVRVRQLDGETGELGLLVSSPEHRGVGVGRALVRFAEALMGSRGLDWMQLELLVPSGWRHPTKDFLHAWYSRLGYRVVARGDFAEAEPDAAPRLATRCDFLVFRKRLSGSRTAERSGQTGLEQAFRTDFEYFEGRAEGIATVDGITIAAARQELAERHGFSSWARLRRHLDALGDGTEPATPFMLAYEALESDDPVRLSELLDEHPELVELRGTNGNDLLGLAGSLRLVRLLLERGADPNRGNDYGWTKLHQAGYGNDRELARLLLDAGGRLDLFARGDGGTPLVAALFWGHREVVDLLGVEPRNLRVAAGLGDLELIRSLAGRPEAGAHRGFYRPHGGFPAWTPSDEPQEVLDEALVWAAKSDRTAALPLLLELGARVDADPYRGTALTWAAALGRTGSVESLLELGADPDRLGSFGGPDHGENVTALHLAAQSGRDAVVEILLAAGADPTVRDARHGGTPAGWAEFGRHGELAARLRQAESQARGGP